MNYLGAISKIFLFILIIKTINANVNAVAELRQLVIDTIEKNLELFDQKDIDTIKIIDNFAKRFYDHSRGNVHAAFHAILKAMKWRKDFGINQLSDTSFPEEFYKAGTLFPYGHDLEGRRVMVLRVKAVKDVSDEWTELYQRFGVYVMDKLAKENDRSDNRGVAVLLDCRDATFENINMDQIRYILDLREHYPMIVRSVIIYELPHTFHYMANMVIMWLPEWQKKLIHVISQENLGDYIAADQLPDFVGGTSLLPYRETPNGVPTVRELGSHMDVDEYETEMLLYHLRPFIEGRA